MSDLICTLHSLHLHPVKSCAAVGVDRALLVETGLQFDRAWMLVDEQDEFVTQRELPRMALVQQRLRGDALELRAPGMLALHVALDRAEASRRVRVWNDSVEAFDMGTLAAQWFSDLLGRPLRLVRFDPDFRRPSEARFSAGVDARTAFADAFALLVTSTASLAEVNRRLGQRGDAAVDIRRFRPNLVLDGIDAHDEDHIDTLSIDTEQGPVTLKLTKPCVRCTIPSVDPASGVQGHEVGDVLAEYRADARAGGALTFGMNAVIVEGIDRELRVGQAVRASYSF